MPSATPNEAKTRKELIDPALLRAGWDVNNRKQVGIEIPVDGFDAAAWQSPERQPLFHGEHEVQSIAFPTA